MIKKRFSLVCSILCLFFSFQPWTAASSTLPKIASNEDGLVFISGVESRNIQVISPYGQLIRKIPLPSEIQSLDFISSCPCGGYLLIADSQKGIAFTLDDRSGAILFRFSNLQNPGPVAISKHRSRYMAVVDQKKNAVLIYTERGAFVREISGRLRFKEASQILLDTENNLWVMDSSSQKIFRFSIQGNLLLTLQSSRQVPMQDLMDMDVSHQGKLHVLDRSGKIWIFSLQGQLLESKDLQQTVTSSNNFCVHPNETYYHVLSSGNQYYQLQSNLAIESKINNLASEPVKKVIVLRIGSKIMEQVGFDIKLIEEPPFIDASTNRSMVPVRVIAEIFGAIVLWNSVKWEVTIQWNQNSIRLVINSDIAWINGTQYQMDARPVIRGDRTFVPIRFIAEAFGSQIQWVPRDQKIVISQ